MSNGPRSAGGSARPAVALREAGPADLPEIQAIYAHHVAHGLASFELEPPDLEEMTRRHQAVIGRGLPYLVAELEGRVRGFASAGPYRPPAYRYTLENTVYVDPAAQRQGIGEALLAALVERSTALGYRRMVAVIGDSANRPSIRLHEKLGFKVAGRIPSVGFKFGRWVDSVILERPLGEGDETLPD
jgi:phosphinothricin acetyltransferase